MYILYYQKDKIFYKKYYYPLNSNTIKRFLDGMDYQPGATRQL